ncbi:MAG: hypothetical protein K5622_05795 [Endomicrobiaceae bacterium]|nr:hypothetical protein [Endomicrobiaceae bacterium]
MKKILVLVLFCGICVLGCNKQQEEVPVEEVAVEEVVTEVNNGENQDNNQQEEIDYEAINELSQKGKDLFSAGDVNGAIDAYTKAIELNRNDGSLYADRGRVKRDSGDLDGAIEDMNKGLELRQEAWMYADRAVAYQSKGEDALALQDYKKALELDPNLDWVSKAIKEIEEKLQAQ